MGRKTQGVYKPEITEPWEISRGKIADWRECEACFWLEKVKGVKPPKGPDFLINSLTDTLLKREMDEFRGKKPHPFFEHCGYPHLIPLDHPDLDKWVDARNFGKTDQHYNTVHKPTNIRFGGGIDDMFVNAKTGELHIVDYKSTAVREEGDFRPEQSLDADYRVGLKWQMDMYVWIGRQRGLNISSESFFLYVDGQNRNEDNSEISGMGITNDRWAQLKFRTTLIPYTADDSWVEDALFGAKETALKPKCPEHSDECGYGEYLEKAFEASK